MATQSYNVLLANGSTIKIDGVSIVQKDGAGLRLLGEDGSVIASWDDGQSKGCWPAAAVVTEPPAPANEAPAS
ncbi:MAG: hypothetical protein ACTHJ3_07750 [Pararhizobium sp.]